MSGEIKGVEMKWENDPKDFERYEELKDRGFNPLRFGFEESFGDMFEDIRKVGTYLSDKIKNYYFRGE